MFTRYTTSIYLDLSFCSLNTTYLFIYLYLDQSTLGGSEASAERKVSRGLINSSLSRKPSHCVCPFIACAQCANLFAWRIALGCFKGSINWIFSL